MNDILQIIVTVNKKDDLITVSKGIDPEFDLEVLTEALASLIMVASKFTEKTPEKVLETVHNKLQIAVKFHGKIERSG